MIGHHHVYVVRLEERQSLSAGPGGEDLVADVLQNAPAQLQARRLIIDQQYRAVRPNGDAILHYPILNLAKRGQVRDEAGYCYVSSLIASPVTKKSRDGISQAGSN